MAVDLDTCEIVDALESASTGFPVFLVAAGAALRAPVIARYTSNAVLVVDSAERRAAALTMPDSHRYEEYFTGTTAARIARVWTTSIASPPYEPTACTKKAFRAARGRQEAPLKPVGRRNTGSRREPGTND